MLKWGTALPGWIELAKDMGEAQSTSQAQPRVRESPKEHATLIYPVAREGDSWQLVMNACNSHPTGSTVWNLPAPCLFSVAAGPKEAVFQTGLQGTCRPPSSSRFPQASLCNRETWPPYSLAWGVKLSKCSSDTFRPLPWLSVKSHLAFQPPHLLGS